MPTEQTLHELLLEHKKLTRKAKNPWHLLTNEHLIQKFLLGSFLLYVLYLLISSTNSPFLTLIFCVLVVYLAWRFTDLIYYARLKHKKSTDQDWNKHYKQRLNYIYAHFEASTKNYKAVPKGRFRFESSLVPYLMGIAPEYIRQTNLGLFEGVYIGLASAQINKESNRQFLFLNFELPEGLEAETAILSPLEFRHPQWESYAFNQTLTGANFSVETSLSSPNFMQAYALSRLIPLYNSLPAEIKFMTQKGTQLYSVIELIPEARFDIRAADFNQQIYKIESLIQRALNLKDKALTR
jgi:hypothetical protein